MPFNVNIRSLSTPANNFSISVETTTTIAELKIALMAQESYNYNLRFVHLFNGATELHNSKTLGFYSITGTVNITSTIGDFYADPFVHPQFVAIPPDSAGERRRKILVNQSWYGYVK